MSCTIYFTPGNVPAVGNPSKSAPFVAGNYESDTQLTALTPDFGDKGDHAIVQLSFASNDLTTTYAEFSFFLDTRAERSLCYGPGLMQNAALNEEVEFIIQARNDNMENRSSGRDDFQVTIKTREEEPQTIPSEIVDNNDGKYFVKYTLDRECEVDIKVAYQNNKGVWEKVRGSPYTASFSAASPANVNTLTGPSLVKNAQAEIMKLQEFMKSTQAGASIKDKDLTEVRELIGVKDCVEQVNIRADETALILDQLTESLAFLQTNNISKDKEIKQTTKLFSDWNNLKKLAKEVKKEINPLVVNESKKNKIVIDRHEEDLKQF